MSYVPEPYRELARDGNTYFKILGFSQHLALMYGSLTRAMFRAERRPGGTGKATADRIALLIVDIQRRVDAAGIATARVADERIRELIEATRVRPPTLGVKDHNGSLIDGIHSRLVPSPIKGAGAVGVADISVLDDATLSPSTNSKRHTYWEAQEFGNPGLVGREIYGVFQPGNVAPRGDQFRVHPVFEARGRGEGKRKKMVVRNEPPAKMFLRRGAYEAFTFRRRLNLQTESYAVKEIEAIILGDSGPPKRGVPRRRP